MDQICLTNLQINLFKFYYDSFAKILKGWLVFSLNEFPLENYLKKLLLHFIQICNNIHVFN